MEVAVIGVAALVHRYGLHGEFRASGSLGLVPLLSSSILLLAAAIFVETRTGCPSSDELVASALSGIRVAYAFYVVAEASYPALATRRQFDHAIGAQLGLLLALFGVYVWAGEWAMLITVILCTLGKGADMWLYINHIAKLKQ